ncbi:MAG TPA: MlaD family protein [Candidatus Dormibacteraeota bacterium]|jgi:virulence factor Mce-like protein|nr:MlaD family protein [Candidatus Dormibacteraeota bacterium]
MRSRWNLPFLVVYAILGVMVLGYLLDQMGGQFLFQPTYRVTAMFSDGSQLMSGDDVTIDGLTVGRVDSVGPVQGGAEAVLALHQRYAPLYRNARAMIDTKNILGESYVELSRGTADAGPLAQGGVIPRSRTLTPVELDQVLDVLDQNTRTQLDSLLDNLGESVDGNGGNLNSEAASLQSVATSLQTVAQAVVNQQADFSSLITSLTKVLETLAAFHSQLRALIGNWDTLMQTLAEREQDLDGLIINENQVMTVVDGALAENAPGLHQAIQTAPQLINGANVYTKNSDTIFGQVSQNQADIANLFYELASVMSGTDSSGNHYWRVYPVSGGLGTISEPLLGQGGGGG